MTQELIDRLSNKVSETENAYEAAAWANALRHVLIAVGIQSNLNAVKSGLPQKRQDQQCQD